VVHIALYVKEVMVQEVIKVRADATVKEAVRIINKHEIACLIVTKNGENVGILIDRDVLKRVIPRSKNPEKAKVTEIMSTPLIVGGSDMYVEDAARLMFKKNIKKFPIMENGKLVGASDLIKYCPNCTHAIIGQGNKRTQGKRVASSKTNEKSHRHLHIT